VGSWRYWIPSMQAVSIGYRAYALDLWGFGDSAKKPDRYTLEGQVHLLEAFLEQLGVARIAAVGHGLGAVVALLFAHRHPEAVDRVMAVGCPLDASAVNTRLRTASPTDLADWLLQRTQAEEPARADTPKVDALAIRTSLDRLEVLDMGQISHGLTTATLLVSGQNDPAIQPPQNGLLTGLSYQTHTILFEGSGHFPMLDEGSKFNRLLGDFLSLDSGESPRNLQLKEEWKRRVR
jgi:pimeloyl-ACP methyl ester carboxylesterase